MVIYNPLSTPVSDYTKVPVSSNQYQVQDSHLDTLTAQVLIMIIEALELFN